MGICEAFPIAVSRPGQKNAPRALFSVVGSFGAVPNLISVSTASVTHGARFQSGLLVFGGRPQLDGSAETSSPKRVGETLYWLATMAALPALSYSWTGRGFYQ